MIRECEEHGYHRNEVCPHCGEEGKFIMSDYEVEKVGRTLAGILRHGKYGLEMDSQGFVSMRDVLAKAIGTNNPHNVLRATMQGLISLRSADEVSELRGKKLEAPRK